MENVVHILKYKMTYISQTLIWHSEFNSGRYVHTQGLFDVGHTKTI